MAIPPIVALEIGTTKICALIGELRDDGVLMVTGIGECPSRGVRKGEIVDFEIALACVRQALAAAEQQSQITMHQVHLVLSGAQIASEVNRGTIHVLNDDREITPKEVDMAMEAARKVNLPPGREVLHSIAQQYYVDSQMGVLNPEGMEGSQLSLDMLVIHGMSVPLRNTIRVARSVPIDVQDVAFGGLCASLAVLTPDQKAGGVLVIDLGGGTADFLVYANKSMALAGTIGVGGDHITNDIALGLKIPTAQAERLKIQSGCALLQPAARGQSVSIPPEGGFPGRHVKMADLHAIIQARQDELLGMIRVILEKHGLLPHLGAGVVLTGGGALMNGLPELVQRVFNLPCMIGKPRSVSGLSTGTGGPEYAAAVGMLRYGVMTAQRVGSESTLSNLIRKVFGKRP